MAATPTSRTLKWLRSNGWQAQVVERWNPHAKIRQDLFGCIDIIAVQGGTVLGVQATSRSNHAARVKKALAEPRLRAWLGAASFWVVSWKKVGRHWDGYLEAILPGDYDDAHARDADGPADG
jgi:Holliday junction resolvase-like predicted endonuclease